MPRFPSPLSLERVSEKAWRLEVDLPADARIEYRLEVAGHGNGEWIIDPANAETASNPFGTNSVYTGPTYRLPNWMDAAPERGTTREIRVRSSCLGGRRHHLLYAPPGVGDDEPLPWLVVLDGADYVAYAGLLRCVESLIADGRIRPVRIVGLNPRKRHEHYVGSDLQAAHIVEEVLPHVARRVAAASSVAVMGASLGAVAAWHAAWRYPNTFSGLFLQSGTFAMGPHPELDDTMARSISRFVAQALNDPRVADMPVVQTCGRWESLIDWNRAVARRLEQVSSRHTYIETWTGHDWGAWSGTLDVGLQSVLGSPGPQGDETPDDERNL